MLRLVTDKKLSGKDNRVRKVKAHMFSSLGETEKLNIDMNYYYIPQLLSEHRNFSFT